MKEKGLAAGSLDETIFSRDFDLSTGDLAITMTSNGLTDKILTLNGTRVGDLGIVKICRRKSPQSSSIVLINDSPFSIKGRVTWEFFKDTMSFFNEKLEEYGLSSGGRDSIINVWYANLPSHEYALRMSSPELAERIMYLNGMPIDRNGSRYHLVVKRPPNYNGPRPRYSSFDEFMNTKNPSKISGRGNKKVDIHEKQGATSSPPSKITTLTAIREENKRLKEQIAQEKENKLLKEEISKLSSSNVSRVEEAKRLKTKIEEERKKLSARDAQVSQLENDIVILDKKLDRVNHENHNVLNVKWQEQCSEISAMDEQIDLLKAEFEDLQRQSQKATDSLLEERKERKAIEERIKQFQYDSVNKPLK